MHLPSPLSPSLSLSLIFIDLFVCFIRKNLSLLSFGDEDELEESAPTGMKSSHHFPSKMLEESMQKRKASKYRRGREGGRKARGERRKRMRRVGK